MLCHGLDFDDTHSDSVAHVSVVVVPSALATAEERGADGHEVLAALVAGNEVVARVGMAAPGTLQEHGFHSTSISGIFGGAVAAGRLRDMTGPALASALGICGSFAGGLFAYLEDGTPTKPMHPAWAAHGALLATALAARGAAGPTTVFEGRFGLYHAFVGAEPGAVDLAGQLADVGARWETPRIAFKPYPACHYMHGSLGATASLLDAVDLEQIEDVEVSVPVQAVALVLEPADTKLAPRTGYEAKFSLQYSTAAMLVHGAVGVRTYTDTAIRDADVLALARRVRYVVREYPTFPAAFPGGVRITLRDGRVLEATEEHQRGAPDNPMARGEVIGKFEANGSLALSDADVATLRERVLALEEQPDLGAVLEPLRRARVADPATAAR
jgi:2-methylcitrate dehydratase PrpD